MTAPEMAAGVTLEAMTSEIASYFADTPCLIWSDEHRLYWRADGHGYTSEPTRAGRYTIADAYARTRHCDPDKGIRFICLAAEAARIAAILSDPRRGAKG